MADNFVTKLVKKLRRTKAEPFVEPTPFEIVDALVLEIADEVAGELRAKANDVNCESTALKAKHRAAATAIQEEFMPRFRERLRERLKEEA